MAKHYLSICAILSDVTNNLDEWIAYHRLVGVEHFFIYGRESYLKDQCLEMVASGVVTLYYVEAIAIHAAARNQCLKISGERTTWMAFINCNEYIVPKQVDSLVPILKRYDIYGGLAANCISFSGKRGKFQSSFDGLLMENCSSCASHQDDPMNTYVRCIVQPAKTRSIAYDMNVMTYKSPFYCVNESFELVDSAFNLPVTNAIIQINRFTLENEREKEEEKEKEKENEKENIVYKCNMQRFFTKTKEMMIWYFMRRTGTHEYTLNLSSPTQTEFLPESAVSRLIPIGCHSVCVFALDRSIDAAMLIYIGIMAMRCDAIVVSTTSSETLNTGSDNLPGNCTILHVPYACNDFGQWFRVMRNAPFSSLDRVFLVSGSFVPTSGKELETMLTRSDKLNPDDRRFWGIRHSKKMQGISPTSYHLQPHFTVYQGDGVPALKLFIESVADTSTQHSPEGKALAIEVMLSRFMVSHGICPCALFQCSGISDDSKVPDSLTEVTPPLGFIILRCVQKEAHSRYWLLCYLHIRHVFGDAPVLIIDDASTVPIKHFHVTNTVIITSEFPGRAELLPYYYFHKLRPFKRAVILHDSMFFNQKVDFDDMPDMALWDFCPATCTYHPYSDAMECANLRRLKDPEGTLLSVWEDKTQMSWRGCFGCCTIMSLSLVDTLANKYNLFELLHTITDRLQRMTLERIIGLLLFLEGKGDRSLNGDITRQTYGYASITYDNLETPAIRAIIRPLVLVKYWTGR
jgi:Glycosyltransferase family 92